MNEKEINLAIYNKLADIAREVFNHLTAEPGRVYTPADIARAITGKALTWAEDYDPATVYEVAEGSFACSVNGCGIFHVLDRVARAWSIATAARVKFIAERAAAPVVASFTLTAAESRELQACCADDQLRPAMCNVHLDTRRRVLVASNGYIMRVVNLGDRLTVTDTAAPYYNIHKSVIKAGRAVTITADNYATAAGVSVACFADIYPNWAQVLNGCRSYSEAGRVALPPATWRELKKAVAYVAKVLHQSKSTPLRVTIAHTQGENVLHIYAHDIDFERERETAVTIDPAAPSFSIDTDARRLAKVTTAAALYVADTCRPIITTDPAGLAMFMPLQPLEGDKYYKPFTIAPAGQTLDPLPGIDIAAAAADITAARHMAAAPAADSIESEGTDTPAEVAAPAADLTADTNEPTPAETIESETAAAEVAAPAALTAAAELLTLAEVRDAAKAIAKAKTADDYDSQRAARDARRLLTTAHGLTVTDYKIKTADGLTLTRFIYTYGKKSRRTLCAPLLKVAAEFATLESLADEWAELTAAETIESETAAAEVAAPAADLTAESEADTITAAERERLADTITTDELTDDTDPEHARFAAGDVFLLLTDTGTTVPARVRSLYFNNFDDTAAPCWVYCYDCEPWINRHGQTIDGGSCDALRMTAPDTPAPAADLTAESEPTAAPVLTITPAPAADSENDTADPLPLLPIATADSQTTDRAERRPLLLTVARYALRLAAAAALLLLLTIAPDRTADTLAAPAADSEADTITAAALLTADSEAESRAEQADPADSPRPAAERRHAPANKRESHARALLTIATADSIAAPLLTIEADTLTADTLAAPAADSIEADTPAEVATLEAAQEITDTPTADTDSEADTITPDEPTDDTDPAAADSQTDSTPTDTAANGHPHAHGSTPAAPAAPCSPSAPVAPVAPILI